MQHPQPQPAGRIFDLLLLILMGLFFMYYSTKKIRGQRVSQYFSTKGVYVESSPITAI